MPSDVGEYQNDPWQALFENERDLERPPNDPGWDRPRPLGTENIVYRDPVEALREHLKEDESAIDAYAKVREFQENGLERRTRVPFSAIDDPLLASVIEENKPWYDAVIETYKPTLLPGKLPDTFDSRGQQTLAYLNLELQQNCRQLARRFRLRSMYRAGHGDLQGSFDDLAFTWKMAARCDHCCLIASAMAASLELHASRAMMMLVLNAEELTPGFSIQIERLPQQSTYKAIVELMDGTERYTWLDVVQGLHSSRCDSESLEMFSDIHFQGSMKFLQSRRLWHATNWNQILVKQNQHFDAMVAALKLPVWKGQQDAVDKLLHAPVASETSRNLDIQSAPPWSGADATESLTEKLLPKVDWYVAAPQQAHLRDLRRRVVQIAARLAMWRQVNGEFPNELESVLTVDGFSLASPTLLVDPFNELQLGYERQGNGFLLYSVGPNMQKDGSGFEECSIQETDFSDNNCPDDDHIWRWPPAD